MMLVFYMTIRKLVKMVASVMWIIMATRHAGKLLYIEKWMTGNVKWLHTWYRYVILSPSPQIKRRKIKDLLIDICSPRAQFSVLWANWPFLFLVLLSFRNDHLCPTSDRHLSGKWLLVSPVLLFFVCIIRFNVTCVAMTSYATRFSVLFA